MKLLFILAVIIMGAVPAEGAAPNEDANAVGIWVLTGLGVLMAVGQALDFYKRHIKEQPDPRETYLSKVEFAFFRDSLSAQLERSEDKLSKAIGELQNTLIDARKSDALSRKDIHRQIDGMNASLSALREAVDTLKQRDALAAIAKAKA